MMKRLELGFLRNLAVLTIGTVVGQAVGVAASPLLTRLYDPHAFGRFGVFSAVVVTVSAAASLKFEQAIVTEKTTGRALEVMTLCGFASILMAVLIPIGVLLAGHHAADWVGGDVAGMLVGYGALSVLVAGVYNALQFWGIRRKAFNVLAGYQVLRSSTVLLCQGGLAFLVAGATGLILGQLIGQVIGLLLLLIAFRADVLRASLLGRHVSRIMDRARAHRDFATFGAPQSVLNALSGNIPTVLLAALFSATESGLFWLAYRMLMLPSLILVESLRSILYQRMGEIHHGGNSLKPILRRSAAQLAAVCAPVALVLVVAGPLLFGFVFGHAWRGAGLACAILAPAWVIQNAAVPSAVGVALLGKQRASFILEAIMTVLRAGAIAVGAAYGSVSMALGLYAAMNTIGAVAIMIVVWRAASQSDKARQAPLAPVFKISGMRSATAGADTGTGELGMVP